MFSCSWPRMNQGYTRSSTIRTAGQIEHANDPMQSTSVVYSVCHRTTRQDTVVEENFDPTITAPRDLSVPETSQTFFFLDESSSMMSTMSEFFPLANELLSALQLLLWLLAALSRLVFVIGPQSMLHLPQLTSSGDQTSSTTKTHKYTTSGTRPRGSAPLPSDYNLTDASMQQGEPCGNDDLGDRPNDGSN